MNTDTCAVCDKPMAMSEPHYTLCLHIEVEQDGCVDVLHGEVLEYRHQYCFHLALDEPAPPGGSITALDCTVCALPVVLADPHYTLWLHVEVDDAWAVTVLDALVLGVRHEQCQRATAGQAPAAGSGVSR
jgi:hypothetical protein